MKNISLTFSDNINSLIEGEREKAETYFEELKLDREEYTGWVNWPADISDDYLENVERIAAAYREKCDKLIVIGIGGSYLGTAAILEAVGGPRQGCPEILYAGNSLSGNYHAQFEKLINDNEVCLCVVSKSGGTMESRLAFSILKSYMYNKYGREEAAKRIIAVTDPSKGILREEVVREGYASFDIPRNIGGRYSAFTAGTLFPLAVAGIDIKALVRGAAEVRNDDAWWKTEGINYALARYAMLESGKSIEVLEYYDPSLHLLGEWCKQLFGESEGKNGTGLFPSSLTFSTDLHSMGQFLQEGHQVFFETLINVLNWDRDVVIPDLTGDKFAGKSLNEINQIALNGVIVAHKKSNIPLVQIKIDDSKEFSIGQLLYFLMMTAAISGKLMGIDPFNQPGVEAYKAEIRKILEA